jgi:hypothetical protein
MNRYLLAAVEQSRFYLLRLFFLNQQPGASMPEVNIVRRKKTQQPRL